MRDRHELDRNELAERFAAWRALQDEQAGKPEAPRDIPTEIRRDDILVIHRGLVADLQKAEKTIAEPGIVPDYEKITEAQALLKDGSDFHKTLAKMNDAFRMVVDLEFVESTLVPLTSTDIGVIAHELVQDFDVAPPQIARDTIIDPVLRVMENFKAHNGTGIDVHEERIQRMLALPPRGITAEGNGNSSHGSFDAIAQWLRSGESEVDPYVEEEGSFPVRAVTGDVRKVTDLLRARQVDYQRRSKSRKVSHQDQATAYLAEGSDFLAVVDRFDDTTLRHSLKEDDEEVMIRLKTVHIKTLQKHFVPPSIIFAPRSERKDKFEPIARIYAGYLEAGGEPVGELKKQFDDLLGGFI